VRSTPLPISAGQREALSSASLPVPGGLAEAEHPSLCAPRRGARQPGLRSRIAGRRFSWPLRCARPRRV